MVDTTLSGNSSTYGAGLIFDSTNDAIEGLGTQLGNKHLLGTIQYSASQVAGGYTPFNLTNLDATGLAALKSDLNGNNPFTIIVTPGNATVAASWQGSNSAVGLQSPILRFNYSIGVAPAVVSTQVGNGSIQRSSVKSFSITFSTAVNFNSSSFTLFQATLNPDGTVAGYTNNVSAGVIATSTDNITWTFTGVTGGILDRNGANGLGFLEDGVYQLVLHGVAVTDLATGTAALGSGDQVVSFANNQTAHSGTGTAQAFHVLYGDLNGDGAVNNNDLNKFKQAFAPSGGTFNAALDFINNGSNITNSDLNQFKSRFLKIVIY